MLLQTNELAVSWSTFPREVHIGSRRSSDSVCGALHMLYARVLHSL
jgi:hypothetical protein